MSRALITGGAGFIGLHLARRLVQDGWQVDLLDNLSRGVADRDFEQLARNPAIALLNRDLGAPELAEEARRDYELVFHFAAILGVSAVAKQPERVLWENLRTTRAALEVARRQTGLRRFVFASTSEVYAGTLEKFTLPIPTPESTALALPELSRPRTSYMLSKIYGEAMCHHSAIPFTVVRPHNVYGPRMGMAHVVPELLQRAHRAAQGEELRIDSPQHTRTFCYVTDAVAMIREAALRPGGAGATLNVGASAPEVTILDLAQRVANAAGKRLRLVPGTDTAGSPQRRCPDVSAIVRLTGCAPQVDLERGIALTYEWYRAAVFDSGAAAAR